MSAPPPEHRVPVSGRLVRRLSNASAEAAEAAAATVSRSRVERSGSRGGHVAVGDAVCSYNPVYAQGMSMALRQAALLGETIDRHGTEQIGPASYRRATPMIDAAWTMASSADLGHADVEGPRTVAWRVLDRYVDRLLRAAHHDPVVANTYLRVVSMITPLQGILHPRIAWRVLRGRRAHTPHATRSPTGATTGQR